MSTIAITKPTYTCEKGIHRVTANVRGKPLWFESSDISLCPSAEAFTSAVLIPAMEKGYNLKINAPLSSVWMSNIKKMAGILAKWWGYKDIEFDGAGHNISCGEKPPRTALCFSGGVDSFFNLLRGRHKIDYLVFIHGFDIRLWDTDRMNSFLSPLQDISRSTGAKLLIIRTNLREHRVSSMVPWGRAHGGVLAAVAYLLSSHIQNMIISASYPFIVDRPHGSHWEIDPLWSSESVQIIHEGAELWRAEKLRIIANEPLVRKYLRVCWENRNSWLNCCCCEKCIRTMVVLTQYGKLDDFSCFPDRASLVNHIDKLPFIDEDLFVVYESFLAQGFEPRLAKSVWALLERSRKRRWSRTARRFCVKNIRYIFRKVNSPFQKKQRIMIR